MDTKYKYKSVENPIINNRWTNQHNDALKNGVEHNLNIDLSRYDKKIVNTIADYCDIEPNEVIIDNSRPSLLDLNKWSHRMVSFCIILSIWTISTIPLWGAKEQGYHMNILQLSSMSIILASCIIIILIVAIKCEKYRIFKIMMPILLISAGIMYFIATIIYADDHCRDSVTNIDNANAHCYIGYIGVQLLGTLKPIYLGLDYMIDIKSKYIRIHIYSMILFVTMLLNIITLMYYGNGIECIDQGTECLSNQLYDIFSSGFWLLLIGAIIIIIQRFGHFHVYRIKKSAELEKKWKCKQLFMITNLMIGSILIVGISFTMIKSDVCIAGLKLSDASYFCYYRLIYALLGIVIVLLYQLFTF